jgi:ATP-dependent helicase/DNAse subunit B
LGTRDLKEPEDGLDALERGNLLHKLLHDVWLDSPRLPGLKTSARLREVIDSGVLENFVDERAMALIHLQDYSPWEREFLLAERERIVALVCRWLTQVELQRIPFEVVEGETRREIAIEDLVQMSLRLDRLDRLVAADGSSSVANDEYILIDYKTGEVDLKGWRPPRLDEPQLPIYADYAVPAQPVAVAFASLRAGKEMGLRGLAARAGILPLPDRRRSPVDTARFSEVLEDWRTDIVDLAREFAAGDARVSPKHGSRTCEYCGLQSLCRVAETGELLRDEDETEPHD